MANAVSSALAEQGVAMGAGNTAALKSQIEEHVFNQVYNELTSNLSADETQKTDLEQRNNLDLEQDVSSLLPRTRRRNDGLIFNKLIIIKNQYLILSVVETQRSQEGTQAPQEARQEEARRQASGSCREAQGACRSEPHEHQGCPTG